MKDFTYSKNREVTVKILIAYHLRDHLKGDLQHLSDYHWLRLIRPYQLFKPLVSTLFEGLLMLKYYMLGRKR